jgi:hypothetical protein
MSKSEKLLEKIRNNPKAVSFDDLDKVLRGCGFIRRQPRNGSSHYYYTIITRLARSHYQFRTNVLMSERFM